MKKNDHYFPTVDWIKDPNEPISWKRITYDSGKKDGAASSEADGVEDVTAGGHTGGNVGPLADGTDAVPTAAGEAEAAPAGAGNEDDANGGVVNGSVAEA